MHFESLENRRMLSATSVNRSALLADISALRTAAKTWVTDIKASSHSIAADVKALPKTDANQQLAKQYKTDVAGVRAVLAKDIKSMITAQAGNVQKVINAFSALEKHPTSSAAQAKLAGAVLAAGLTLDGPIQKLGSDITSSGKAIGDHLDALIAANPDDTQLGTDVSAIKSTFAADLSAVTTHANTLKTDIQALIGKFAF